MVTPVLDLKKMNNKKLLDIVILNPNETEKNAAIVILNYRRTRAININSWILSIFTIVLAIAAILQIFYR